MIDHLDHLVLTTARKAECIEFYANLLGNGLESCVGGTTPIEQRALGFGNQKIKLHVKGREFERKTHVPMPGSLDLCFVASVPLDVVARLKSTGIPVLEEPV